eukprot:7245119-Pyramimonas_sp.AAC.1
MHEAQQANLAMQATRQRRHQDRQANIMLGRAGQPADSNTAGTPVSSPAMAASMQLPTLSPIRFEAGESTLERQMRIRPAATPPIISDGGSGKCAICLDLLMNHDKIWRLQCGHIFHAQCWDRVVHAHVDRQLAGNVEVSASEAPCAICR